MSEALLILFALLGWFVVITVAAVGWRILRGRPSAADVAREELRARYARGELSHDEYERESARVSRP